MSVLIVDLSNNNGSVDFARVAKVPGLKGVYLKATEGETYTDATFQHRRRDAAAAGLKVGAYHFARPHSHADPTREANHFCAVVGHVGLGELRPVLDYEEGAPAPVEWAREWNQLVKAQLDVGPIFYSYPSYIEGMGAAKPVGYGLWLASFGRNDGAEHPYSVPAPWKRAVMHQFTSNARVPGVAGFCDVSSAGSLAPLLAHPPKRRAA